MKMKYRLLILIFYLVFIYLFIHVEVLHLPTDMNEIVTVICVLGKCVSLP